MTDEVIHIDEIKQRERGLGTIVQVGKRFKLYLPINGQKKYIGSFATHEMADEHARTILIEHRGDLGTPTWLEISEAYILRIKSRLKSWQSYQDTFESIIKTAPFIHEPVDVTSRPTMVKWADELPDTPKKRSIVRNGKRKTVNLKEKISHSHAINAVAVLRGIWKYACDLGYLKFGDGLCAALHVPQDRFVNKGGKASRMPVLALDEIELLLTCKACSPEDRRRAADPEMLASCPHCAFEVRVAYAIEIHQALRKGELQGMNWEACDWANHGWSIRQNRDGSTKGRKDTWQAWLPRAERFLRKWWELAGKPETGIMFPSRRKRPKQTGARRRFVASQPESMKASEVVRRAALQGIQLTELTVYQYRSAERKVNTTAPAVRYAEGYDWGWSGCAGSKAKSQSYRPSWPERLGVTTRITFHQLRDTCASHLLSGSWGAKWDIKDVSVHLTHETQAITEKRYAHLLHEAKRRTAQRTETDPTYAAAARSVSVRYLGAEVNLSNSAESLAPEPGLEPGTTRLTGEYSSNDHNGLARFGYQTDTEAHRDAQAGAIGNALAETLLSAAVLGVWNASTARAFALWASGVEALRSDAELFLRAPEVQAAKAALVSAARRVHEAGAALWPSGGTPSAAGLELRDSN